VFWFPEDHFDLMPLPSAWMGSFNLDLESRSRAIRTERRKKRDARKSGRRMLNGGDAESPEEMERLRVLNSIEQHQVRLLEEKERPEKRTKRQELDVSNCERIVKEVQRTISTQSQSSARSQARLLVLAHSKMLYERRMDLVRREELLLDNLERHRPGVPGHSSSSHTSSSYSSSEQENYEFKRENSQRYMFREELHSIFLEHADNGPKRKKTRRFRRSGSLDGNARGKFS